MAETRSIQWIDALKEATHRLAMYTLQSDLYKKDLDIQKAVDDVLSLIMDMKS